MFIKKITKKLLALGALAMFALAAAGCGGSDKADAPKDAADGKLIIAINATFPPFESVKEGTHDYVGIDIDMARYIGKKLGKEVTFTDMKFASLVPTLQSGRADMIVSAISPTDERKKVLSFSEPYYYPMKAIICQKNAGYDSFDKLQGKKAGASMGTTYVQELKDAGGIDVVELDNTPLVVQDILNGRLAAGLFDAAQAAVFVSQNDKLEMHTLNLPIVYADTFAIALPKDSKDVEKINGILKEMQANGEMHKILAKHLGETATKQYEEVVAKLDIAK